MSSGGGYVSLPLVISFRWISQTRQEGYIHDGSDARKGEFRFRVLVYLHQD